MVKHDYDDAEYNGNKKTRERAKGSLADRLDLLERIVFKAGFDDSGLSKKDKEKLKKIKKGEKDNPEGDD